MQPFWRVIRGLGASSPLAELELGKAQTRTNIVRIALEYVNMLTFIFIFRHFFAKAKKLKGARISLPIATVTGTENLMMAAVLATGKTTIKNAAKEKARRTTKT